MSPNETLEKRIAAIENEINAKSQQTLAELKKKVEVLELERLHIKVGVSVIGITLLLFAGYTITSLPREIARVATNTLPPLVRAKADELLPKLVEDQAKSQLPNLVQDAATRQIDVLVPKSAEALVPKLQEEIDRRLTTILNERSEDVSRIRKSMLAEYSTVFGDAATAKRTLSDVQTLIDKVSPHAHLLETTVKLLQDKVTVLDGQVKRIEDSDAARIARIMDELNKSPDAQKLLEAILALREEINSMKNGTSSLTLSGLKIRNGLGKTVIQLGANGQLDMLDNDGVVLVNLNIESDKRGGTLVLTGKSDDPKIGPPWVEATGRSLPRLTPAKELR